MENLESSISLISCVLSLLFFFGNIVYSIIIWKKGKFNDCLKDFLDYLNLIETVEFPKLIADSSGSQKALLFFCYNSVLSRKLKLMKRFVVRKRSQYFKNIEESMKDFNRLPLNENFERVIYGQKNSSLDNSCVSFLVHEHIEKICTAAIDE